MLEQIATSHPSRVRGLKYIVNQCQMMLAIGSHPSRVRGLKFHIIPSNETVYMSHPSRVRGLK